MSSLTTPSSSSLFLPLVLLLSLLLSPSPTLSLDLSSNALPDDVIAFINADSAILWNASLNPTFYNRDLAYVQSLCGVQGLHHPPPSPIPSPSSPNTSTTQPPPPSLLASGLSSTLPARRYDDVRDEDIPASFDSRERWGSVCPSLRDVRNQGNCGSCWAFGAVEAMTDRTCIASEGQVQPYLSASDPLSCCSECGDGCDGGTLAEVWSYWVDVGIVTGRGYGDATSCFPYQFPDCSHHTPDPAHSCSDTSTTTTPTAQACPSSACPSLTYPTAFLSDKHFGSSAYHLPTPRDMQLDILRHGPIEAAFLVYSDFPAYHNGVYHRTEKGQDVLGGHAIKVVGWGVEGGVEYWLCVNSWAVEWGDAGTFKIKKGVNECGIEEMAYAGLPALGEGRRK